MGDGSANSRARRALGGLLSLTIVAGAGAGGWFAYDRMVAGSTTDAAPTGTSVPVAPPTTEPSGAPTPAPWPADLVIPAEPWASFRTSYQPFDDVIRQQVDFDPLTDQARMTLFTPFGAEVAFVEVRGLEVWAIQDDAWQQPAANAEITAEFMSGAAFAGSRPKTLPELLPEPAWPHTAMIADSPLDDPELTGTRRLVFAVDTRSFSLASPVAAADWRAAVDFGVGWDPALWTIDLDADGHMVRIDTGGDEPLTVWYAELTEPVAFSSPLGP